jgi:alpha-mannosidase
VPFEILHEGPGYRHVRFLAKDIPAMGFKCYSVVARGSNAKPLDSEAKDSTAAATDMIENAYYRVQADAGSGALKSILDKEANRELVDGRSPYKFNQYVYVQGGGNGPTQIVYMRKSLPFAELKVTPAGDGRIVGVKKTPFGQVLTLESKGVHTLQVRTEILLYDSEKKIEFVNHITKDPVREKEAVYFAFPVATAKPSFEYEIQNGVVNPAKDMIRGAGLEWFSVQHWVKAESPSVDVAIVPVDAPLVTLGDINRGRWLESFDPKSSTIFSYVFNNYWHTNFRAEQGGETTFRYVMTSGVQLTPAELSRLGRAAMTPLEADQVIDQDKVGDPDRPLEPAPASFLQLEGDGVVVENWKAAEDGNGTVLRLLETGGMESHAALKFPLLDVQQVWLCTAMEDNLREIPVKAGTVQLTLKPHEIATLRISGKFRSPGK